MIPFQYFEQLIGDRPLYRLRCALREQPRVNLPTGLQALARYGVPDDLVAELRGLLRPQDSAAREAMIVGQFLLVVMRDDCFQAREALARWISRRGGLDAGDYQLVNRVAERFIAANQSPLMADRDLLVVQARPG